jgi:hypothetical protein
MLAPRWSTRDVGQAPRALDGTRRAPLTPVPMDALIPLRRRDSPDTQRTERGCAVSGAGSCAGVICRAFPSLDAPWGVLILTFRTDTNTEAACKSWDINTRQ